MIDPNRIVSFFVGELSQRVRTGDPLLDSLAQWAGRVQEQAMNKWRPTILSGEMCDMSANRAPCQFSAAARCVACGAQVCLGHCFVASSADVVCYRCVGGAVAAGRAEMPGRAPRPQAPPHPGPAPRPQQAPAPPGDNEQRRIHLRTIGVRKKSASWSEIEKAYRTRLIEFHPDRAEEQDKAAYETKFKQVRAAYDWLTAHRNTEAA